MNVGDKGFLKVSNNGSKHNIVDTISTTTTTTLARIRGFSIELLFLLESNDLTVSDLVFLTDKYDQYVREYLYRLKKYGLVDRNSPFWSLTPLGYSFLQKRKEIQKYIGKKKEERRKKKEETKQKQNRNKTETKQKQNSIVNINNQEKPAKKQHQQLSLDLWKRKHTLDETEGVVVEVLVRHYNETGTPYLLAEDQYELCEKLGIDLCNLRQAIKNLKQDGVIYFGNYEKSLGLWKIGLLKRFIEELKVGGV